MGRRTLNQTMRLNALRSVASTLGPYDFVSLGEYLQQVYHATKKQLSGYSYKDFSADLGLGLGNSSWLIIRGKRSPSVASLGRIASALDLTGDKRKFFLLLGKFSEEKDALLREKILKDLLAIKRHSMSDSSAQIELDFYSDWYHAIIFEMVGLADFSSDPAWIVERINAAISAKQVQDSLEMLEKLGCIRFDPDQSRHVKVLSDFETKSEVPGVGIMRFHQKMIDLAKESIETVPHDEREIGAVTVAVSKEGMEAIKKTIQTFRKYLMVLAAEYGAQPDTVLQMNIQMFPIVAPASTKTKK